MSLFKEIHESHEIIKAKAVNLLIIPFWYVALFLFNNEFYKAENYFIIVPMCIVLSLPATFLMAIVVAVGLDYQTKNVDEEISYLDCSTASVSILTAWLALLIFIVYSCGFLFGQFIFFYWFLVIFYAPVVMLFLIAIGMAIKKTIK